MQFFTQNKREANNNINKLTNINFIELKENKIKNIL